MLARWFVAQAERDLGTNRSGIVSSSPTVGFQRRVTVMLSRLVKFQVKVAALRSDRGATAVEYGLMVALIAIVIAVAVTLLGKNLSSLFGSVATTV